MPRRGNINPSPPRARLVSLSGDSLPGDALASPLVQAGFECHAAEISELQDPTRTGAAVILWVDEDWDGGFALIEGWPEMLRSRAVLIGKRHIKGLLSRVVRSGALAAGTVPIPSWFPAPLAEALERMEGPFRRRFAEELGSLQKAQAEPLEPQDLLLRIAQSAGRLLGADLAVPLLTFTEGARAFVRAADGTVALESWPSGTDRLQAPEQIAGGLREQLETVIVPSTEPGQRLHAGLGLTEFEAGILAPILSHGTTLAAGPSLFVCLNLYWQRSFLPTPAELSALEVLKVIARFAATLLAEQGSRANMQEVTRRVYTESLRAVPPPEAGSPEASWQRLAFELASAYSRWSGFRALWIRPPQLRSAVDERWIRFPEDSRERPFPLEPHSPQENPELVRLDGGWGVRAFGTELDARYGEVIALFTSRSAASVARSDVLGLATALFTTYGLQQRADDTSTLYKLTVPGQSEEAQADLLQTLEIVKDRLASDGAKVFVMVRDAEGPRIWQLANTDFPDAAPNPPRFLGDRGMSDWVVRHRTWLLVPNLSKKPGEVLETAWSGEGPVEVYSRPAEHHRPEHPRPDREDTMLLVPLLAEGQTIGALAVWRETPTPYEKELDPGSLLYFAPHVATACRRMLQLLTGRAELLAIENLTRSLGRSKSLPEAWSIVANGVRELASSKLAVLLRFDPDVGDYFLAAFAEAKPRLPSKVTSGLSHFRCAATQIGNPYTAVESALTARLPGLAFRTTLIPKGSKGPAPVIVALFDPLRTTNEPLLLPDDLLDHYARSYLQTASGMLETYPDTLASRLIDDIGVSDNWAAVSAEEVLEQAADKLWGATGAEAVILYTGTEEQMTVRSSRPKNDHLKDLTVRPESMTRRSLVDKEIKRVLDIDAHGSGLDRSNLQRMETALGWKATGSWLCCPVVHRDRSVGLIKLLTSSSGPFLGPDQGRITKQVAERTAAEMYKASSREHWHDLLLFIGKISGFYGQRFEQELIKALLLWLRKALLRPRCEVAIMSRIGPEGLPSLKVASSGAKPHLESLSRLSRGNDRTPITAGGIATIQQPALGVIAPLFLPVERRLAGHLFVLDAARFYPDDLETIEKATQHLAFLVDNEIRREEWRQTMGRFRHTLLGPVQGLTSAAKQLAADAETAGVPTEALRKPRLSILKESELIRLWRVNHRFYLSRDIEIARRRVALRPVFDRCVDRYQPIAEQRGIKLTLDFQPRGELQASVDESAIDIALSNLLDNACKYAFYNRSVVLGVAVVPGTMRIWVENFGTPIPPEIGDLIYNFGQRGAVRDPLRSITGQGIGLSMVMLIVAAHDGTLTHSSVRENPRSREERAQTPYRVRFTIELPWF